MQEVGGVVRNVNLPYLGLAILLFFCYMLTYVVRWRAILAYYRVNIPLVQLVKIVFAGSFFGDFTPSRIGDLSRVYLLKRHYRVPTALSVYTAALDKFYDIVISSVLALLGLWLIARQYSIATGLLSTPLVILLIVLVFGIYFLRNSGKMVKRLSLLLAKKHMLHAAAMTSLRTIYHKKPFPHQLQYRLIGLSTLVVLFMGGGAYALLLSLGSTVHFIQLLFLLKIGVAISFLPFTIAGLGVVESYTAAIFPTVLGISAGSAAGYAIVYRVLTISVHATGFVGYLVKKPK